MHNILTIKSRRYSKYILHNVAYTMLTQQVDENKMPRIRIEWGTIPLQLTPSFHFYQSPPEPQHLFFVGRGQG